jgi:hypothetical protein
MGLQIQILKASTGGEIEAAFATFVRERPDALFVGNDAFLTSRRVQFSLLAAFHRLPATYSHGLDPKLTLHEPDQSITSSAKTSKVVGMLRPSALAVWRLITSSSLVCWKTGRSIGLSPFRILAAYSPAW